MSGPRTGAGPSDSDARGNQRNEERRGSVLCCCFYTIVYGGDVSKILSTRYSLKLVGMIRVN